MCVVSMVSDFYQQQIQRRPLSEWFPSPPQTQITITPSLIAEISELRKLIAEFREAMAAAKRVDDLTGQPDCVDPKKATLVDRVADLEKRLDSIGV